LKTSATICFLGHPNSGKTTLFNHFSGLRFKTVNYPGSSVEVAMANLTLGQTLVQVMDTPGIVSLWPRSEDERVTRKVLEKQPNLVVLVMDATQLRRHLPLFKQCKEAQIPLVVALTMCDVLQQRGDSINLDSLKSLLQVPIVPIFGRTGAGVEALKEVCKHFLTETYTLSLPTENSQESLQEQFAWAQNIQDLVYKKGPNKTLLDLDRFLLHPHWGLFVFVGIMSALFFSVYALAAPLMDGIDFGFGWLNTSLAQILPHHWLTEFLLDGVLAGTGAVLVFVPQIAILFLLMAFLETSGYLARGAVLVDRPLSSIGLNGKSFVPLLCGCACAIPALMATRTIPGKKEKLITQCIIPLMTCSARLPVYGLLLGLLLPNAFWAGLGLALIYVASVALSAVVSAIASKLMGQAADDFGFQIELPKWHLPVFKHSFAHAADQTFSFIKRAGPTILVVSTVLWALTRFPVPEASFLTQIGHFIEPMLKPMGIDWRVGVALLMAFAAREVFVSALAIVFFVSSAQTESLLYALKHAVWTGSAQPIFTSSTVIGLILFFMVAMQCMSTVAVAKKEMGNWTYPLALTGGYILAAYGLAVGVVQFLKVFGL